MDAAGSASSAAEQLAFTVAPPRPYDGRAYRAGLNWINKEHKHSK